VHIYYLIINIGYALVCANMDIKPKNKVRIRRGRPAGVALKDIPERSNPNERPNIARFSVATPADMQRVIRRIRGNLDMTFSQMMRNGIDEVVRMNKHKISQATWKMYWDLRKQVYDEDWSGEP